MLYHLGRLVAGTYLILVTSASRNSFRIRDVQGHPTAGKEYPEHEGYTLTLVEEFDGPIDLDKDPIWTWSDGGLGEGRVRFVRDAISFADGKMILTAVRNDSGWGWEPCSHANAGTWPRVFELHSGEMRTKYNMFRYGRYEVRMKAPMIQPGDRMVNGNFVATMFVYKDGSNRHWREVDIEVTGGDFDTVTTNVLWADNTTKWFAEMGAPLEIQVGESVREDFHTYAFEWLPTGITWFFDGQVIRTFDNTSADEFENTNPDEETAGDAYNFTLRNVPELAGKIMLNLWIFGEGYSFGGLDGDNNQYPMSVEYDWFRYYRWNGDGQYPCADLSNPECLTEDDMWLAGNNPCDGIAQKGLNCSAVCRR